MHTKKRLADMCLVDECHDKKGREVAFGNCGVCGNRFNSVLRCCQWFVLSTNINLLFPICSAGFGLLMTTDGGLAS